MRSQGTAQELERRRRLAVTRVLEGYPVGEVAAFLTSENDSGEILTQVLMFILLKRCSRTRLALLQPGRSITGFDRVPSERP